MVGSAGLPGDGTAVFAIDSQQRITMWSPAAEQLLQLDSAQALGAHCYEVFAASDPFGRPVCRPGCQVVESIGSEHPVLSRHLVVPRQNGAKLHLTFDVVPLPHGPGPRAIILMKESRQGGYAGSELFQMPGARPDQPDGGSVGSMLRYLSALGTISATPVSPDLNQALEKALSDILGATGAEVAEVFLSADQGKEMVLTAHKGLFRDTFLEINRFKLGEGFPGLVAASGRPIITSALGLDTRYLRTKVKEKGFQFYICVPLLTENGVIGSVNITSRRQEADIPSRLQFLSWVAPSLSASVEMSWLRGRDRLSDYDVDPLTSAADSSDRIPAHILETIMAVAGAEAGAVAVYETASGTFRTVAARGAFGDNLCGALSHGETSRCPLLTENRAILCYGPRHGWPTLCRDLSREMATAVCLPLRVDGDLVGAIVIGERSGGKLWTTKHLSVLSAMADKAALAIKNSQLHLRPGGSLVRDEVTPAASEVGLSLEVSSPDGPDRRQPKDGLLLDIRCFGRFQLYLDGRLLSPAVFRRSKSLTVLKILITYRKQPLTREGLMEHLWPETDPEAASQRLRVVIHDLRRGLSLASTAANSLIVAEGGNYRFNTQASYRLDVDRFLKGTKDGNRLYTQGDRRGALKAYRSTVRIYQGDFLEDERYSDWCSAERERLRETYLVLLEKMAAILAEEGDLAGSARYLQRALTVDGLREAVHRQLMRYLWDAGRSDEALRQYATCKKVLAEELGVEPLKETEELRRRILEDRGENIKS